MYWCLEVSDIGSVDQLKGLAEPLTVTLTGVTVLVVWSMSVADILGFCDAAAVPVPVRGLETELPATGAVTVIVRSPWCGSLPSKWQWNFISFLLSRW